MAADVVLARPKDGEGNDSQREQRQNVGGTPRSQVRVVRMKSDVPATRIMSSAHGQPIARCGTIPLGASSYTAPKPIAAKAKAKAA
jgi:hypothetical protein